MIINGRIYATGENIVVGDVILLNVDSNPASSNYTWNSSNQTIARGVSMIVTEEMLGTQSFNIVVCNIIPIPSSTTVCNVLPVTILVIGKFVCIILIVTGILLQYCRL